MANEDSQFPKRCTKCQKAHSYAEFRALPFDGFQEAGLAGVVIEQRRCNALRGYVACNGTMGVVVDRQAKIPLTASAAQLLILV